MSRARCLLVSLGASLLLATVGFPGLAAAEAEEQDANVVADGSRVSIEYTLSLADGSVVDSNVGATPLIYEQGASQILPALESELDSLEVGDRKEIALTAAQGYGEVDQDLYQSIPASDIPEDARTVGTMLLAQGDGGQQRQVRVHEVKDEEIVLDLNHPLAGQALHFDIKILAIE